MAELLLTVDVGWCTSPPSLSSPARVANRHYEGLSSIEVLIDAILMLSIIINYNNLQHVHREMGTIQKLVIEIVQRQLKHLWLAAASKLLKRGIYINKMSLYQKGLVCQVGFVAPFSSFWASSSKWKSSAARSYLLLPPLKSCFGAFV